MSLEEVCDVLGVSIKTGYNWLSLNAFPMPTYKRGNRIMIDIRDLAEHLDRVRENARIEYGKRQDKEAEHTRQLRDSR
ncbi:helix-turn-helix domain-containing protein [Caballeronia calidae]|uniref:helix-turn-helix domain-containing protein n=1 Tax=Caballeronia calidae TaxID=1777139 RepID=UPI0009407290|nr:helix-turn-helix domain-containing protein [Caballeronia calidae]